MRRRTIVLVLYIAVAFAAGFFTNHRLTRKNPEPPVTVVEYVVDNSPAIRRVKLEEALVTGFKKEQKLIVMEAELTENITLDASFADWEVFKKLQTVTIAATGKFTVDLGEISAGDIIYDDFNNQAAISLMRPVVDSLTVNEEQTVFHSVERGLLRFGEIKLTTAEQNEIYAQAKAAMLPKLKLDMAETAEEYAKESVSDLARKFLGPVGMSNYDIIVVWK